MNLLALRLKLKKIKNDSPLDREWTKQTNMVWHPTTGQMVALFNLLKPASIGGMLKTEDIEACEALLWQTHELLVKGKIDELALLELDPIRCVIQSRVVPRCDSQTAPLLKLRPGSNLEKALSPSRVATGATA